MYTTVTICSQAHTHHSPDLRHALTSLPDIMATISPTRRYSLLDSEGGAGGKSWTKA